MVCFLPVTTLLHSRRVWTVHDGQVIDVRTSALCNIVLKVNTIPPTTHRPILMGGSKGRPVWQHFRVGKFPQPILIPYVKVWKHHRPGATRTSFA